VGGGGRDSEFEGNKGFGGDGGLRVMEGLRVGRSFIEVNLKGFQMPLCQDRH